METKELTKKNLNKTDAIALILVLIAVLCIVLGFIISTFAFVGVICGFGYFLFGLLSRYVLNAKRVKQLEEEKK